MELLNMSIAGHSQQYKSTRVRDIADDIAFLGDIAAECKNLSHLGSAVCLTQLVHAHHAGVFVPEGKGRYAK
jgi:hypothetical protein